MSPVFAEIQIFLVLCLCVYACVALTYKGKVWRILAQQSGKDSLSLDTLLVFEHISIHEAVLHGGVRMNINVELQTNPLTKRQQNERDKR